MIAFDYPTKSKIGVTTDGRIFNYSNPVPPISCIDQEGVKHLNELVSEDSIYFKSSKPGYLIINFGILKPSVLPKLSSDYGGGVPGDPPGKDPDCEKLSPYVSTDVQGNILHIDVLSSNAEWMELDKVYPRINPCRNLTELSQYVIPGQDLKIRLRWDKFYKIDHIAYYTFDNSYITLYRLPLSSAQHSDDGNITGPLSGIDANKGTLCLNQEISLSFLAPKEDPQKQRGFVLVTKGYYVKTEQNYSPKLSSGFQVQQNYPNPFNPVTQIKFSLPQATKVTLTIYNILGQKVITLINKEMEAGDHSIYWNGRNSAGEGVASGIYLYQLQTEDFSKTKKMLLLR